MSFYLALLQLSGAVALLLFAARMVRTGMERALRTRLRQLMTGLAKSHMRGAGVGLLMAVLLQSSTAVAMLAASFAASGKLSIGAGLAIMLGADLGSALVVQILSLKVNWLLPLLVSVGVFLFFKGRSRGVRQSGRILVGIALVLLSLQMIGSATLPLRENPAVPGIAAYLAGDLFTSLLLGASCTWLLHSSIASVLLFATIAAQGVFSVEVAYALILGANIGSGLIAFGLTRAQPAAARSITVGNLVFRTIAASCVFLALAGFGVPMTQSNADLGRQILTFHLVFNVGLLMSCLPFISLMRRLVASLIREAAHIEPFGRQPMGPTCLDPAVRSAPGLALASATRELLRMAELVELMLEPLMQLYQTGDREVIRHARSLEVAVDRAQREIKAYLAQIDYNAGTNQDVARGQELSSIAVNLEYAGDAIAKTLLDLAEIRRDRSIAFSPAGWAELNELHRQVMANLKLALNVLVSRDLESARLLVQRKDEMRRAVEASYRRHFERLRAGGASVDSSNIHLETLRTLKSINSHFASIAHPILAQSGELLSSRLKKAH